MQHFFRFVLAPFIREAGYAKICEIGACDGGNSELLQTLPGVELTVVDPCMDFDLEVKFRNSPRTTVMRALSLEALARMEEPFDCFLIDGDHNWYTVTRELEAIDRKDLLKPGGAIFLHDVGWPYGRRDLYYLPDSIPVEHRQPYEKNGIVRGQSRLAPSGINGHLFNAVREGGPKNGVLTAIEDFVKERKSKYRFFRLEEEYGLGVVVRRDGAADEIRGAKWAFRFRSRRLVRRLKDAAKLLLGRR